MVGGPGKVKINSDILLALQDRKVKVEDFVVYVHVKGYMRARVTHMDIEDRCLSKII